jgi:hypothetical protein
MTMSDSRSWSRLFLILATCLAVAACGGPGSSGGDEGSKTGSEASDGDGGTGGDGGAGSGSADGPITAAMESGTYGFDVGRCEIIDDVVYATALNQDQLGSFEATLPPWDRDVAYAQRDGQISLTNYGAANGDNFELVASRSQIGTTWDWTVSGSNVEVMARMANRTTSTRENGIEQFSEYREVTINIECANGAFGSGDFVTQFEEQEFYPIEPSLERAPGSVTIDLDGSTYEVTYLSTCQFFSQDVTAEGKADEADVWLYSEGAGVHLDLLIGDSRAPEEGTQWTLPPDVQLQDDFLFTGSDTTRTWTGTIVSTDGTEAEAAITVECTEGDAFEAAGTASVVLDGVTHNLDEVTSCSISGAMVEFFGVSTATDVAIVVTGDLILLGDENGQQTSTGGVQFVVSGQQATWTGVLAGNRSATVTISCG